MRKLVLILALFLLALPVSSCSKEKADPDESSIVPSYDTIHEGDPGWEEFE